MIKADNTQRSNRPLKNASPNSDAKPLKQGVALTGRNTTGPLCSREAIIRLEAT